MNLSSEDLAAIVAALRPVIREELAASMQPAPVVAEPTGGAYQFNRTFDFYGKGEWVQTADEAENVRRACAGIRWNGDVVYDAGPFLDAIWGEIEGLKAADPKLVPSYQALDPAFACFGLLTGLFDPIAQDAVTFGINSNKRASYAGQTISSFVQAQLDRVGQPGGPSGAPV